MAQELIPRPHGGPDSKRMQGDLSKIIRPPSKINIKLTPEQQAEMDRNARAEQAKWPAWKKTVEKGLDVGSGIASGLLGTEPKPAREAGIKDWANVATQVLTGVIPAPALMKKLGLNMLTHGSPKATNIIKEGFNPDLNYRNDILGWMTHAAERPKYASTWASKHIESDPVGAGIIPLAPKGLVADLTNPDIDDITRIAAALPPERRRILIENFRERHSRQPNRMISPAQAPEYELREHIEKMSPLQFEKTGLDAVRYNDMGESAWAFPRPGESLVGAFSNRPIGGKLPKEYRTRQPFIAGPEGIQPPAFRETSPKYGRTEEKLFDFNMNKKVEEIIPSILSPKSKNYMQKNSHYEFGLANEDGEIIDLSTQADSWWLKEGEIVVKNPFYSGR